MIFAQSYRFFWTIIKNIYEKQNCVSKTIIKDDFIFKIVLQISYS